MQANRLTKHTDPTNREVIDLKRLPGRCTLKRKLLAEALQPARISAASLSKASGGIIACAGRTLHQRLRQQRQETEMAVKTSTGHFCSGRLLVNITLVEHKQPRSYIHKTIKHKVKTLIVSSKTINSERFFSNMPQ